MNTLSTMWRAGAPILSTVALGMLAGCEARSNSGGSSSGGQPSGPPPISVAQRFPIDGHADFAVLPDVQTAVLQFKSSIGTGAPTGALAVLRWAFVHDDRDLYVAVEWNDATYDHLHDPVLGPLDYDGVKLFFDVDGGGFYEAGDDGRTVIAASVGSNYVDQHPDVGDREDRIGDGKGRLAYDEVSGLYTAEFLIPIADDANGEDGVLSAASRYDIAVYDHVQPALGTGHLASLHGIGTLGTLTGAWERVPFLDVPPHAHPKLPKDLEGLIVFTSSHENPKRDIYTFDPAKRAVRRVTNVPGYFKDSVSLSHDRQRVAFHAAPEEANQDGFEIYVMNVDGSGLTQLTSNAWLDGHPAWSPDDQRIAFASWRGGSSAIVVVALDGTELAVLTPPGYDDNDPDYLPDGRIVFKTDRFNTLPKVQIAVMGEDGSNPQQLSFVDGVSDHDPMAFGTRVAFERFPKDTLYATDPDSGFVGWPLVELDLVTGVERVLVSDGAVNWLPSYDPTGRWLAHLKSAGYTDVRLIDREGRDLGRLIPGFTRVHYIDWK